MSNNQIKQAIEVAARNVAMALISDPGLAVVAHTPNCLPGSRPPSTHDIVEAIVKDVLYSSIVRGEGYGDGSSVVSENATEEEGNGN